MDQKLDSREVYTLEEAIEMLAKKNMVIDVSLEQPHEPGNQPDEPGNQPGEPGNQPDEPGNQPDEPGNQPGEPGNQPDEPGNQPGEPGNQPEEPGYAKEIEELFKDPWKYLAMNTQGNQPDEPGNQPGEPGNQPDEPANQPDEPGYAKEIEKLFKDPWKYVAMNTQGNQPDEPGKQPDEPGNQPDEPGNQPGEPGNQPDEPGNQPGEPGYAKKIENLLQDLEEYLAMDPRVDQPEDPAEDHEVYNEMSPVRSRGSTGAAGPGWNPKTLVDQALSKQLASKNVPSQSSAPVQDTLHGSTGKTPAAAQGGEISSGSTERRICVSYILNDGPEEYVVNSTSSSCSLLAVLPQEEMDERSDVIKELVQSGQTQEHDPSSSSQTRVPGTKSQLNERGPCGKPKKRKQELVQSGQTQEHDPSSSSQTRVPGTKSQLNERKQSPGAVKQQIYREKEKRKSMQQRTDLGNMTDERNQLLQTVKDKDKKIEDLVKQNLYLTNERDFLRSLFTKRSIPQMPNHVEEPDN